MRNFVKNFIRDDRSGAWICLRIAKVTLEGRTIEKNAGDRINPGEIVVLGHDLVELMDNASAELNGG